MPAAMFRTGALLAALAGMASSAEVARGALRGNLLVPGDQAAPELKLQVPAVAIGGSDKAGGQNEEVKASSLASEWERTHSDGHAPIRIARGPPPAKEVDGVSVSSVSANSSAASSSSGSMAVKDALAGWTIHHVFGVIIFFGFSMSLCFIIPIIRTEHEFYDAQVKGNGDKFSDYLSYRFMDWFTQRNYAPPVVLSFVTATLIVTGALIYSVLVGGSPSHALWRIFVWSTGSPAEGEVTGGGRFLGTIVTVCGLIILSLLLGIVTETFASKMTEIKSGMTRVVEGGHTVILGYSDCTRCLLEELSNARESEGGGVFVILSKEDKVVIEQKVSGDILNLRNSRVIVRSGSQSAIRDLQKVSAGSASQIVILADTTVSAEEADARSIRTLLSLKAKGWPTHGRIVVQCCSEANTNLFRQLYGPGGEDKVEVVIVGNIVAQLMARSSEQHGLATVFGMMLGFEGDEFYSEEWEELVGKTFREAVFRFPEAVALGIMKNGRCKLNPGWDYKITEGDRIIVLAEDNDAYEPVDTAWCNEEAQRGLPKSVDSPMKRNARHSPRSGRQKRFLLIGWNTKVGSLLGSLNDMVSEGSEITIYSPCPIPEREGEIQKYELQNGKHLQTKFKFHHIHVEETKFSSRIELSKLEHHTYDSVFVLADTACTNTAADERSMAVLAQLTHLHEKGPGERDFDPVVEMCEDSTFEHLKICGFTNFVHSNSLVSQALAAVTEDASVNSIYADLMSGVTNSFEFVQFEVFLSPSDKAAFHAQGSERKISFWEAAHYASLAGDISVVGWTLEVDSPGTEPKFILNPKDKTTKRVWRDQDRIVIIRSLE